MLNRKNVTQSVDKRNQGIICKTKSFKELLQKHNFEGEAKVKKYIRNFKKDCPECWYKKLHGQGNN